MILAVVSLAASLSGLAQVTARATQQPLPNAPVSRQRLSDHFYPYSGLFCGSGVSTSGVATNPTAGCGVGLTLLPLPIYTEIGVMGPQANRSYLSGYVSVGASIPLAKTSSTYLPVALLGYSRLFETGHALNYGVALILPHP